MKLIKRDFVPKDTKSIKNYPLASGKAYYIRDDSGDVLYASKEHAKELFPEDDFTRVVDLTKGLIRNYIRNGGRGGNNGGSTVDVYLEREKQAIVYLLLTQEKMVNFSGCRYKLNDSFLSGVYDFYGQNNFISRKQVDIVLNKEVENANDEKLKSKLGHKKLSLKNLQTCYAYEYKIKRAIEELPADKQEYMLSMLSHLYQNLYLTDPQIDGMIKWFEYLPDDLKDTRLKKFDV